MARKSLEAYALLHAIEVLGSAAEVARCLGISQTRLKLYLEELQPMPGALFLRIVDLLLDVEVARLSNEAKAQRSRRNGREASSNNGDRNGNGKRG